MKALKRITVVCVAIIFSIALLPVSAFADVVATEETYATGCMPVFQIFGQSHNVEYIFDAETTQENINMLIDLWNQYTTVDPTAPTLGSMYNQIISEGTYEVTSYNSMQYLAFNISALLNQKLCAFFDWVLSGPAEMTKVDNQYYEWSVDQQTGIVNSIPIYVITPLGSKLPTVDSNLTVAQKYNAGITMLYRSDLGYYRAYEVNSCETYLFYTSLNNGTATIYGITPSGGSSSFGYAYPYGNSYDSSYGVMNTAVSVNNITYYYGSKSIPNVSDLFIPFFADVNAAISAYDDYVNYGTGGGNVSVRPYLDDSEITLPDPSEVSQPVRLVSNSQLPSFQGDTDTGITTAQTVDDIASSVIDNVMAGDTGILDTNVTPETGTEVYIPLLPVTLPSFNFSFSGIWHYVVTWVGTLGSWLSLMFTVWQSLPYAIVVPVYATAVIVIVIGTLKRFL